MNLMYYLMKYFFVFMYRKNTSAVAMTDSSHNVHTAPALGPRANSNNDARAYMNVLGAAYLYTA